MKFISVDYEKCRGCNSCTLACSITKGRKFNPSKANLSIVKFAEKSDVTFPMLCQQCLEPPCMDICPAQAISRDEKSGAIVINENLCIGCKMCIMACPIGGPWVDGENHKIMKCDLCDGDPLCVKYCAFGALEFVTAEDAALKNRKEGIKNILKLLDKFNS